MLDTLGGGDHSEDLGIDWKIILKLILNTFVERVGTGFIWLSIEIVDLNNAMNLVPEKVDNFLMS